MRNRRVRSAADYGIDFSRFTNDNHPALDPVYDGLSDRAVDHRTAKDFEATERMGQIELHFCMLSKQEQVQCKEELLSEELAMIVFLPPEVRQRIMSLPRDRRYKALLEAEERMENENGQK